MKKNMLVVFGPGDAEQVAAESEPSHAIAQVRLAQAIAGHFGHAWSGAVLPDVREMTTGEIAVCTAMTVDPGPMGLGIDAPTTQPDGSLGACTATGRTSWDVRPDLSVVADIARPDPDSTEHGAGVVVLRALVAPDGAIRVTRLRSDMAICARHVDAMRHVLVAVLLAHDAEYAETRRVLFAVPADMGDHPLMASYLSHREAADERAGEALAGLRDVIPEGNHGRMEWGVPQTWPAWGQRTPAGWLAPRGWSVAASVDDVVYVGDEEHAHRAYRMLVDGETRAAIDAVRLARRLDRDRVVELESLQAALELN